MHDQEAGFASKRESRRDFLRGSAAVAGVAGVLIEPNRKALEALFRYSHEQGLARKKLKIEELFHPSALELVDG